MAALILFGDQFFCRLYLVRGWSNPENGFVWSEARACTLRLPKLRKARKLVVRLHGNVFATDRVPQQRLRVLHAGTCVCEQSIGSSRTLRFEFNVEPSPEDFIELNLELPDATSPREAGISSDARTLAFSLNWASIIETDFANVGLPSLTLFPAASLPNETRSWVQERREGDVHVVNHICDAYDEGRASVTDVIDAYIAGAASEIHIRLRLVALINGAPEFAGTAGPIHELTLWPEHLAGLSPRLINWLPKPSALNVTVEQLWPRSPNNLRQTSFPVTYAGTLFDEMINAFSIKSSREMGLCASTYRFVLFDPKTKAVYRPIVSQGSSSIAIEGPEVTVDGRVIVLPDRFDGGNVAHLMFDTLTRMLHFIRQHGYRTTDLFYFGGIPTGFHDVVLDAVSAFHGIRQESIFFPKSPVRLMATDGLYWFNDQEAYHHPAQLMHPRSREIFRWLGDLIGAEANGRKLYLSRADASLRRIVNEPELMDMLARHGYEFVELSQLDFRTQIAMVSGAAAIVAPHGMGMTHLIFNRHKPRVIELFNPSMGSNCYAWMAYALGFDYTPVAGTEVDPVKYDYTVEVQAIEALLGFGGTSLVHMNT